ncbi:YdcF family protein [Dyella amyloliquefaciens]|uniref:YdcF family protein n=1 Tax=Dyella amyloliquefaciens TaxID=1770545 RepID=UPI00102E6C19|nr:YdcF family protein [Dyella amyloliquefaciens]
MLSVLFAMMLLAWWCFRRRWRRFGTVMATLTVVLLFAVGSGAIPRILLHPLQGHYSPAPRIDWAGTNVIVLLAGGTAVVGDEPLQPSYFADGRVLRAAQLYSECHAAGKVCRLLVTGGDSQDHGEAESVVYGRALRRLGIPETDILLETRSMTTWQNAQFSRPILVAQAPQHVVLVTSGVHLRRSLLYFGHFGIEPQPVAGDWVNPRRELFPDSWNVLLTDACMHEYLGILRYYVYNALGMNAPPSPRLGD